MASEFETVRRRHAHVQKGSVEFLIGEASGGSGAAGEGARLEAGGAQEFGNQLTGNRVVVYNKDPGTRPISFFRQIKLPRLAGRW
jgi:hypothetical protein